MNSTANVGRLEVSCEQVYFCSTLKIIFWIRIWKNISLSLSLHQLDGLRISQSAIINSLSHWVFTAKLKLTLRFELVGCLVKKSIVQYLNSLSLYGAVKVCSSSRFCLTMRWVSLCFLDPALLTVPHPSTLSSRFDSVWFRSQSQPPSPTTLLIHLQYCIDVTLCLLTSSRWLTITSQPPHPVMKNWLWTKTVQIYPFNWSPSHLNLHQFHSPASIQPLSPLLVLITIQLLFNLLHLSLCQS